MDDLNILYDDSITNMTNKEAAEIIKKMIQASVNLIGRGNGKTHKILETHMALIKAVDLLENTPD